MRRERTTPPLALLAIAGCWLAGCSGLQLGTPRKPPGRVIPYRRVAVVEFFDHSRYSSYGYGGDFSRALAEKLADETATTDVVLVPRSSLRDEHDPFVSGRMPLDVLVQVREECKADAIIVGSLDQINPYRAPSVQISLKFIDTATGRVLFSLSERWDAGQKPVQSMMDAYCRRNHVSDDGRYGPDLVLNSPRYFLRFVADQVAPRIISSL